MQNKFHKAISAKNYVAGKILFFAQKLNFYLQGVKLGSGCTGRGRIYIRNHGEVNIGSKFRYNSGNVYNPIGGDSILRIIVGPSAKLKIGNGVSISNSTIVSKKSIIIGNDVKIGGSCKIWDTNFHNISAELRREHNEIKPRSQEVIIENDVWLGFGVIVLPGARIGQGSIISANSVVYGCVPSNEIWRGNPASFYKKIK